MKVLSTCFCFVAAAFWLADGVSAQHDGVVHMSADKVAALADKGGRIAALPDANVTINVRTGPGQSEVHDKETDTFYILDGAATFVTGGKVIAGKTTAPGQTRGASIEGGHAVQLKKGDVIVIPAGTPHWFKEVPARVSYYTVKAIRP